MMVELISSDISPSSYTKNTSTTVSSNFTATVNYAYRKSNQRGDTRFYPEVHLVATNLVPVETISKVVTGSLASGDSQVRLSHVECIEEL